MDQDIKTVNLFGKYLHINAFETFSLSASFEDDPSTLTYICVSNHHLSLRMTLLVVSYYYLFVLYCSSNDAEDAKPIIGYCKNTLGVLFFESCLDCCSGHYQNYGNCKALCNEDMNEASDELHGCEGMWHPSIRKGKTW